MAVRHQFNYTYQQEDLGYLHQFFWKTDETKNKLLAYKNDVLSGYLYLKIKKKTSSGRYCKKTYLQGCFLQFRP